MDIEKNSLVSIITPSLNSEKYIQETIESINCQTYKNIEHIVVDGGSTDGTLDIIKRYQHIKLVCGPDKGMYDAINKGIRASRGEIIAYLNSDDLYLPDTVKIAVDNFARWPEVELIYGDCYYINEAGKVLYKYRYPQFDWNLWLMCRRPLIAQPTAFWRRSVHDKYGLFDSSFKLLGDCEFFMMVCSGKLVRHCDHTMAKFRLRNDRMSKVIVEPRAHEQKAIQDKWSNLRAENRISVLLSIIKLKTINSPAIIKKWWLHFMGEPF